LILSRRGAGAHSSLVHMFETVRRKFGGASVPRAGRNFLGQLADDGSWTLDFEATLAAWPKTQNSNSKTQN